MEITRQVIKEVLDRVAAQPLVVFLAFSMTYNVFGTKVYLRQVDKTEASMLKQVDAANATVRAQDRTIELQEREKRRLDDDIRRLSDTNRRINIQ